MEAVSLLIYPFAACVLLILIHAYFGMHVLERGIIFVDLSLAQFIGLGIALSFFMGYEDSGKNIFAFSFAILGALILSFSRRIERLINIEAFIGALYIFSLAGSILILDRTPHGLEEFKAILNGNILWITGRELFHTFALYLFIGILHFVFRKRFLSLSYEGKSSPAWEFLFFLSFALALVKSVQMAGILQVFSFLVIPAMTGRLYTKRPLNVLLTGWLTGLGASIFGIVLSYRLDVPTAPLIVASLCIIFFLLLFERMLIKAVLQYQR
jgi:zinc/manganese transport system permease protein